MYSTTPQTRAAYRTEVQGTRPVRSGPALADLPISASYRNGLPPAKRKRVTSMIGGPDSGGLVIHGSSEFPDSIGTDPDSTDPNYAGDAFRNYKYPIRYQGPGHMQFQSPVSIPGIVGDVSINGSLKVTGSIEPNIGGPVTPLSATGDSAIQLLANTAVFPYSVEPANITSRTVSGFFQTSEGKCFFKINMSWIGAGSSVTGRLAIPMLACGLPAPLRTTGGVDLFAATGTVTRATGIVIPDVHDSLRLDVDISPYIATTANEPYLRIAIEKHSSEPATDGLEYLAESSITATGYLRCSGWYFIPTVV